MIITPIKTEPFLPNSTKLTDFIDSYITELTERSILLVTSKIIGIAEGSILPISTNDKKELIVKEAELYLPPEDNRYGITLTVKNGILIPSAGIDESNTDGYYVLWPRDAQKTANQIRAFFAKKYKLKEFGVIITDSKTTPLRRGTTGVALAHSGFLALNNYMGELDIFNRPLRVTKANIMDGIAVAGVLIMGEGGELTPLAVATDLPFVTFTKANPTQEELDNLRISLEEDLYGPILTAADWQKGKNGRS